MSHSTNVWTPFKSKLLILYASIGVCHASKHLASQAVLAPPPVPVTLHDCVRRDNAIHYQTDGVASA